jgi:flagellar L-ring protein precursor FlgH
MWLLLAAAALLCVVSGCASHPKPAPTVFDGELPELELPNSPRPVSPGSLYTENGGADLVGDFRARHVGDVLVVRVSESALGASSADNKLEKSESTAVKAPVMFGWENKVAGNLGPDFDPSLALQTSTERQFEGEGETSRSQQLTANIAVRVLAVGTGGRMLIAGTKEVDLNHEHQKLTLAGIVRPEDVGPNNTISSNAVADLRISYGGTGDLADVTRQGWFHRLMAKIWPF